MTVEKRYPLPWPVTNSITKAAVCSVNPPKRILGGLGITEGAITEGAITEGDITYGTTTTGAITFSGPAKLFVNGKAL